MEVKGHHMRGYVDGQLVTDAAEGPRVTPLPAFASATYDTPSHSVIVKLVNVGTTPVDAAINLHGVGHVEPHGTATVLAGDRKAVNTVDEPTHVAPRQEALTNASPSFHRTLPPHSLTVLRLTVARQE